MIKCKELVPEIYYNKSRDFQALGRIYDILFNYAKNNIDFLNRSSHNNSKVMLDLLCSTLGFKVKHLYNVEELAALCTIFIDCIRGKGTQKSIQLLADMICYINGVDAQAEIRTDEGQFLILMPSEVTDLTLMKDVLNYIMPAGLSYSLVSQNLLSQPNETVLATSDNVQGKESLSLIFGRIVPVTGPDSILVYKNKDIETGTWTDYNTGTGPQNLDTGKTGKGRIAGPGIIDDSSKEDKLKEIQANLYENAEEE